MYFKKVSMVLVIMLLVGTLLLGCEIIPPVQVDSLAEGVDDTLTVDFGTEKQAVIDQLPQELEVILSDGTTATTTSINWGSDTYDSQVAASYQFVGSDIIIEEELVKGTVYFTVIVDVVVVSFVNPIAIDGTTVNPGTPIDDLNLPVEEDVNLSDGNQATASITWDTGSYNPDEAGTYTLVASFKINDDPIEGTIEITVTVASLGVINVVTDVQPISVPYGTPEADVITELGNTYGSLSVELNDGTTKDADVTWSAPVNYDSSVVDSYQFVGSFKIDGEPIGGTVEVSVAVEQIDETIKVTLIDYSGAPIDGVVVTLTSDNNDDVLSSEDTTTNAQGEVVFTLTANSDGSRTLTATSADVYGEISQEINL